MPPITKPSTAANTAISSGRPRNIRVIYGPSSAMLSKRAAEIRCAEFGFTPNCIQTPLFVFPLPGPPQPGADTFLNHRPLEFSKHGAKRSNGAAEPVFVDVHDLAAHSPGGPAIPRRDATTDFGFCFRPKLYWCVQRRSPQPYEIGGHGSR
jgi:hypothetical protein